MVGYDSSLLKHSKYTGTQKRDGAGDRNRTYNLRIKVRCSAIEPRQHVPWEPRLPTIRISLNCLERGRYALSIAQKVKKPENNILSGKEYYFPGFELF